MSDSEGSNSSTKIKTEVPPDSDSGEDIDPDVFTVERIVDSRKNAHGLTEYELKWKNYPSSENTWEPESNIFDQSLIDDFLLRRKKEKRKRQKKLEQLDSETKKLKDIQLKNKQDKKKNKRKDKLKGFIVSSESDSSNEASKNKMPPPRVSSKGDKKVKRKEKESGQNMNFKKEGSGGSMKQRNSDSASKDESLLDLDEPSSPFGKRDMKVKTEPGSRSGSGGAKPRPPPSHKDVDISNMLGERKLKPSHSKKVNKGKVLKDKTGAIQNSSSKEKEKDTRIHIPKNLDRESETGLGRGYKIDFVIGLRQNESGHIFYLVKYVGDQEEEDEYVEFVLSSIVVDHEPTKVIEYYQSILKFIPMSELQNRGLTKIVPDSDPAWPASSSYSGSSSISAGSDATDIELEPNSGTATETDSAKDELLGLEEDVKDIALTHGSEAGTSSSVKLLALVEKTIEVITL